MWAKEVMGCPPKYVDATHNTYRVVCCQENCRPTALPIAHSLGKFRQLPSRIYLPAEVPPGLSTTCWSSSVLTIW